MSNTATARFTSIAVLSTSLFFAGCKQTVQDGVLATVNGVAIQKAEVDKLYNIQLANSPGQQVASQDQSDAIRLNILRELIDSQIIEQRAAKLNLTASNDEVEAKFNVMKAPYSEEVFQARLKASNSTVDDVKHDLRRSLTTDKLLNKEINSKISVTDDDVSKYFNAHKAEFNLAENQFHLAQIIVSANPATNATNLQNSKASSIEDAKKKVQALKNRLDSGEDFGLIAMNFSEDPNTAPNGGDRGLLSESQLRSNPMVYAAMGKLKPGGISDIIPFPDPNDPKKIGGFAIFQLIERAAAGQRDLSDPRVQQEIRKQLQDSRSTLLKSAYSEMLHNQAKIQNFFAEQIFKNAK